MSRLLLLIASGVVVLYAQTPVGGPSLGFAYDAQGQALHPILGMAGASTFGDALQVPTPVASAAFSAHHNVAIVGDGAGDWNAITLTGPTAGTAALPAGLPVSARVTVSETGAAAAFYDAANSALSVVTGIPSAMALSAVSLDALPGAITRFAIGDDGSLLLSSSVSGGGEALEWIGPDGSSRQLASLQKTAAIRLWKQGANALVVDRGANQVWQIQNPGGNAAITLLASATDGVAAPVGAALSGGGSQLWIANTGTAAVLGVNLQSRATVSLSCGFNLTTLTPMGDGTSFRLNELNGGPLWLLDTTAGVGPRVVFVPAIAVPANNTEAAQ